jgi:hypothetical protein
MNQQVQNADRKNIEALVGTISKRLLSGVLLCLAVRIVILSSYAQTTGGPSGTIRGLVLDPSGAAIKGATAEVRNPVSHYSRLRQTDDQGSFAFENLPFNNYHLTVSAPAFQTDERDLDVRSAVPVDLRVTLQIGSATTAMTVTPDSKDLIHVDPVSQTDLDRELFAKLPLESQSSSLSSLVTLATPGVAADSNGLFHGLGDHAENSFSIDGQPITDQQSKVFSNQIPLDSVQSVKVFEGAPPAEYGDKTSLVMIVTTRSGKGVAHPQGEVSTSYGTFGTANTAFNLAYGGQNWGNFFWFVSQKCN